MTNSSLRDFAKRDMKGNWFMAVVMFIVLTIITTILNQIFSSVMPGSPNIEEMLGVGQNTIGYSSAFNYRNYINLGLIGNAIATLFSLGYTWSYLDLVNQAHELEFPKLKIEYLFAAMNRKFLKYIFIILLKNIFIGLGFLLFIIPGIMLSFMFIPLEYLLIEDPNKPFFDYFRECSRLMKGNKGKYFSLILPYLLALLFIILVPIVSIAVMFSGENGGGPGVFIGSMLIYIPVLFILIVYFAIKIQILSAEFYGRHLVPRASYYQTDNEVYDYNNVH